MNEALSSIPYYQPLFEHMAYNHEVLLTNSEMDEVCHVVEKLRGLSAREAELASALLEFQRVEKVFGHTGQHADEECADCKRVRKADKALSHGYLDADKSLLRPMALIRRFADKWHYDNNGQKNCRWCDSYDGHSPDCPIPEAISTL